MRIRYQKYNGVVVKVMPYVPRSHIPTNQMPLNGSSQHQHKQIPENIPSSRMFSESTNHGPTNDHNEYNVGGYKRALEISYGEGVGVGKLRKKRF